MRRKVNRTLFPGEKKNTAVDFVQNGGKYAKALRKKSGEVREDAVKMERCNIDE